MDNLHQVMYPDHKTKNGIYSYLTTELRDFGEGHGLTPK